MSNKSCAPMVEVLSNSSVSIPLVFLVSIRCFLALVEFIVEALPYYVSERLDLVYNACSSILEISFDDIIDP